jgi:hypothetical protein
MGSKVSSTASAVVSPLPTGASGGRRHALPALWAGARALLWALALSGPPWFALPARAEQLPEYRLKAAFLYNFALLTEWPSNVGGTLHLCVQGADPFGTELDALEGRAVGDRSIVVQRRSIGDDLSGCQIVFIAPSAMGGLSLVLDELRGSKVLTVADSPDAVRRGVALGMTVAQNKVTFAANLLAAHGAGLNFSSKLLRLATEVIQ